MKKSLQFQQFSSHVDISFWKELGRRKLDEYRLSDDAVKISGVYDVARHGGKLGARLSVSSDSFVALEKQSNDIKGVCTYGILRNFNTIEDFKAADRSSMLEELGKMIWDDVLSGEAITHPERLNPFLVVTFADLKKHVFVYWFAFPVLLPSTAFIKSYEIKAANSLLSEKSSLTQLEEGILNEDKRPEPIFFLKLKEKNKKAFEVFPFHKLFEKDLESKDFENIVIGFLDPCSLPDYPGWPLRNLLFLLHYHLQLKKVTVLCYRDYNCKFENSVKSKLLTVEFLDRQKDGQKYPFTKVGGWERNQKNKMGPRHVNLSRFMDSRMLADSAVDLNLKLMRWRIIPELNVSQLSQTKCLLFGAGTLGCYVSRALIGWGVRNITLLDNGTVSYSNPVRQPLYEFSDCSSGEGGKGADKAVAAAASLQRIFPGVNAKGIRMSIPMPGHAVGAGENEEKVRSNTTAIEKLVKEHDVLFLLTDTRESRWLPSVLGARHKKLTINAALGFDTFMVMRHGNRINQLGCYFCNDVVGPQDSMSNRALDQQCTVTRPGLAAIASATAVELLVNVLHHPKGAAAPADSAQPLSYRPSQGGQGSALGLVPHQIRGFLSHFSRILPVAKCFDRCIACSSSVVSAYNEDLVVNACNDSKYLERLTGLDELQRQAEAALDEIDAFDDSEDEW
eukprot:g898.t1